MSKTFERRMGATVVELREASDTVTLSGYASTYDQPYDMGWYKETVSPGAFRMSLNRLPDVRLLVNHGGLPLARTPTPAGNPRGKLLLDGEDSRGLRVSAELGLDDPDVQALVPKMRRGDLNQMSFSFRVSGPDGDEWSKDMSERTLRTLDIQDGDVSVVTYPANPGATAALRSAGQAPLDAIASAMRALETRDASTENIASVLTRALAYFTAVDLIVDEAQEDIAEALGVPNPDDETDDMAQMPADDMVPMRAAAVAKELRERVLALIG